MSLLCHAVVAWDTKSSLSVIFSVHIVVDVLTNACIAWSRVQGGEGGMYTGGIRNTFQNLFKFIFDPDNFCCRWCFVFESPEGSEREIVHCKMLLTCELLQLIGR